MLDQGQDQAAGLRRMMGAGRASLMTFALGGGAEDGWIVPLARALRRLGARPMVMDASRGRLAQGFGLRPRHELLDLLQGRRDFDGVAEFTADGVCVVRSDQGLDAFVASGTPPQQLFAAVAGLSHGFDALMLAMPAHELASLASPSQAVPVIAIDPTEAGITRAYATVKSLASDFGYQRFAAAVRERGEGPSGRGAHARLATVAQGFLGAQVQLAGCVPCGAHAPAAMAELAHNLLHTAATPLLLH